MTTKQTTHTAKLKAAGWKRQDVWLSPDDLMRLQALQRATGASAQAVLRRGLREMPSELPLVYAERVVSAEDLRAEYAADPREPVALWMIARSYATGHGDTVEDMLGELEWQAQERAPTGLSPEAESAWFCYRALVEDR